MYYALKFSYCYIAITLAMCLDNIAWIPDAPEYSSIRKNFKEFTLLKRIFAIPINKEGLSYVWNKRIMEVIKHPRDIIPATISSAILGAIL